MSLPNSSVILAAGNGKRLGDVVSHKPKGFIELDGLPIIERSIRQLRAIGIEDTVIVTGYAAEYYETLAQKYPQIRLVKNEIYAETDSMTSLYCAKAYVQDDFLLLESDLVYEQRGLVALANFPKANAILTSGFTYSDDEVFVSVYDNRVIDLSKQPSRKWPIIGELVGISKISAGMYQAMLTYAEATFQRDKNLCYEDCINGIATKVEVFPCRIADLIWAEIDTPAHLERVKQKILPQLSAEWH